MDIVHIEINNEFIPFVGSDNPTGHFRAFMNYCIDNHLDQIVINPELRKWFSIIPNDPIFKSAFDRGSVSEHNQIYYSTNSGTPEKIGIMYHLANVLELGLYVSTV